MHFRKTALSLALLSLVVQADEIGNVSSLNAKENAIEIKTSKGVLLRIEMTAKDIFRIWAGPNGRLIDAENKAAAIVINKDFVPAAYKIKEEADHSVISTEHYALRIYKKPLRFALYKADNQTRIWQEIKPLDISKAGSYQTLNSDANEQFLGGGQQNGHFAFKGKNLEISYSGGWEENDRPSPAPFYMSNKGYGVLRNTWSNGMYDFRSNDYLSTTHQENRFDAYYFVGDSIKEVLASYTALTGRAPLLARWAFEYGDADCYNDGNNIKKPNTYPKNWSDGPSGKTLDVVESVAAKYREYDMPGGWILPNDGYGCGYSNLPEVVAGLKKYGFKTGLWTENGVEKIASEVGGAGTRAQKLDVAWTGQGYQFSLDANKAAADGILQNSDSRPFIWTVMGWAGTQRYAVTWTGDQSGSWDYIRWHIPTLIGSGLSGQAYATGDVDGIFGGSPETFTRDLQWKTFTPVLMGMSGWSQAVRKHPWWFDEPYRSINRDYLKLKMRLTPYMYTTAHEAEQSGAPIVRGLMWDHPHDLNAFNEAYKNQFFLGRDLLIAPVYQSQSASQGWRKDIYLPQGQWIDYWDGTLTEAGAAGLKIDMPVSLEKLPVLVRAGAIIPMYPSALYDGQVPKDSVTLDIYPRGESSFTLYEDDGLTRAYQTGASSLQTIKVKAPLDGSGDIQISIGAISGQYQGMLGSRSYPLQVHSRIKPDRVSLAGQDLPEFINKAELEHAQSGWLFDAALQYGVVFIKTPAIASNAMLQATLHIASGQPLALSKPYPAMPKAGNRLADVYVLNRPFEETGHPLENAFDGKPETWFRSKRNPPQKTGPHEFTLGLGERKLVAGFEIAPRNDQHWKYGQIKDFEIYLSDKNGEWGEPAFRGRLKREQAMQTVNFAPKAGSLLRFRVLSVHSPEDGQTGQDEMVKAAVTASAQAAFNAFNIEAVEPITFSEFHLLTTPLSDKAKQLSYLSDASWSTASGKLIQKNAAMLMNKLAFKKGLGITGQSRIDYTLAGNWQLFRADVGIDDRCRNMGSMAFQIYADDKLLYNSGQMSAPTVVKPELDIRGIKTLSLRSSAQLKSCGNWANAMVIGFEGDKIGK